MIETIKDQWPTLILIPLTVSIVANVLTPIFRKVLASLLAVSAAKFNSGMLGLVKLRVRQINKEINEIEEISSSHPALMKHYRITVSYISLGIWILLLSPLLGFAAQALALLYTQHFPDTSMMLLNNTGFVFFATIGALFAAGPFQAALYSSHINKRLKKLSEAPHELIEKLQKERDQLLGR